jgi:hypothetical protein
MSRLVPKRRMQSVRPAARIQLARSLFASFKPRRSARIERWKHVDGQRPRPERNCGNPSVDEPSAITDHHNRIGQSRFGSELVPLAVVGIELVKLEPVWENGGILDRIPECAPPQQVSLPALWPVAPQTRCNCFYRACRRCVSHNGD